MIKEEVAKTFLRMTLLTKFKGWKNVVHRLPPGQIDRREKTCLSACALDRSISSSLTMHVIQKQ